ncbi:MAG: AraC family transcriptional regulator ligand-binding domain-containing protein [Actinomycetota bacterium]
MADAQIPGTGDRYALDPTTRALLVDMGMNPARVLRRAGLPADMFSGTKQVWLRPDEFFAVWQAMEDESDDPDLALAFAEAFSPEVFAPPVFAALLSTNLSVAADRLISYKRLLGAVHFSIRHEARTTSIVYEWGETGSAPRTLVLAELLFWVALARTGTRERIEPLRITSPFLPANDARYTEYLGVEITESEAKAVTFAAADAARPFLTANDVLWQTFDPELRRRLSELEISAPITEQVRGALLELLPTGKAKADDVAGELAMSNRTLHRRLKAAGSTFQAELDATRENLARHYLRNHAVSTSEIAFLLGYEEPSSFYRAFHKWTGETPANVRADLVGA